MKQWMRENWAKYFVRMAFVVVAGGFFIPRVAARLEAHVQARQAVLAASSVDSVVVKAGVEEWDHEVVDSCGIKTLVVRSFTAISETGDTLTEQSADSTCWTLDYHTQPLKVVLLQRTQQDGTTCLIAVVHVPYDIYQVLVRE